MGAKDAPIPSDAPAPPQSKNEKQEPAQPSQKTKKRRSRWRMFGVFVLVLTGLLCIGRAMLPWAVRRYVNRTLDRSPLYQGRIGDVELHLWHRAYSIRDDRIVKGTGEVPVPIFTAQRRALLMSCHALVHHRLVSVILIMY